MTGYSSRIEADRHFSTRAEDTQEELMTTMLKLTMLTMFTLLFVASATMFAAGTTDTLNVNYFTNANTSGAPDGTVQLTNPGTYNGGNICAEIYVFYPDEEMAACCGCTLSPDDLRTLSINKDITSNPLTGVVPTNGVIKVVSNTTANGCDPRHLSPVAAVRAWGTHVLSPSTGGFAITETEFQNATLSAGETAGLAAQCSAIYLDGSGHGICSCGTGF